jgi:hypothetical protein
MRGAIRTGAYGLGCAGLAVLTLVTPAAGERNAPGRAPSGDLAADCDDASMNTPRGGPGDLKLTADVRDGATVAPGQDITLTLSWDPKRWSGPELDRALDCVRVKGGLEPDLSAEEAPTANDGAWDSTLHVPENIKPGCDICAEGFLAGDAAGGGPLELRSDRYCFLSGRPVPPPPAPPVTRPPAPPTRSAPAPMPVSSTTTTAPQPVRVPTEVAGTTAGRPSVALAPAPVTAPAPAPAAAPAELPRTGSDGSRPGAAGGGLALSLGGLAVMGGAGRRNRRRAAV